MRAEAFGEIGILPKDFYRLDISEYVLLRKGFFDRKINEQRVLRKVVMCVIAPWVKQMPDPYRFFPVAGDDELREWNKEQMIQVSKRAMERLRRFKELEQGQKPKEN